MTNHNTRQRIMRYLADNGPSTVGALSDDLAAPLSSVRWNLHQMLHHSPRLVSRDGMTANAAWLWGLTEAGRGELEVDSGDLRRELDEATDLIADLVAQACSGGGEGQLDSMASGTYTEAMLWLADRQRLMITSHVGRRVLGRWP